MKRRDLFKQMVAAVALSVAPIPSALAQEAPNPFSQALDRLMAVKSPDVLCFGDDNHNDSTIIRDFAEIENLELLRAHDVKSLVVEYPSDLGPYVVGTATGEFSHEALMDLVENALDYGIEAAAEEGHEIGEFERRSRLDYLTERAKETVNLIQNANALGIVVMLQDSYPLAEQVRMGILIEANADGSADLLRDRLKEVDPEVARVTQDMMDSLGGRAAVFYGSVHFAMRFPAGGLDHPNIDDNLRDRGLETAFIVLNNSLGAEEYRDQYDGITASANETGAPVTFFQNAGFERVDMFYNSGDVEVSLHPDLMEHSGSPVLDNNSSNRPQNAQ